eukprot:m.93048 g.93048  ORF g.93048 m.93048 type:complete len:164 (-) comp15357_c0_seq1:1598-2089(-)
MDGVGTKRGMEDDSAVSGKRPAGDVAAMKILVPNFLAGTIIGKGGSCIAETQNETGARVHLSQAREYFPGTTDRVVMLQGSLPSVRAALIIIVTKTLATDRVVPEGVTTPTLAPPPMIKMAVPAGAAGSIIGHGGELIKKLHEETGAKVQISPKSLLAQVSVL